MKRLTLMIAAVAMSATFTAFSQNGSRENTREEVRQYMDKNVFPLMEKQQAKYLKKLSDAEKAELGTLKEKIADRDFKQPKGPFIPDLLNDIKKITDAHPQLNASYKEFIDKNKQTWIADIKAIHEKNDVKQMRNKNGNMGIDVFFTRASNPGWLLLFDPSNPRLAHAMAMRSNNNFKYKSKAQGKKPRNPKLKAEIEAYALENIVPVIAEERSDFDKLLNDSEKKTIGIARLKIQDRKTMFKNWYASNDFVPGNRAKNPNLDSMRTDMQNSMIGIREIALAHNAEIRESTNRIKSHADEWEKGITAIAENNDQDPEYVLRMMMKQMRKSSTPFSFLLFDPDKIGETDFFDIDKENEARVIVYPNPVVQNAIIAVINAAGKNVQVTLFTKDGKKLNTLYDGPNENQRLEVTFNTSDLDNNIYLIKVLTGDSEIARKIVVKH